MLATQTRAPVRIKNILLATDFSDCSQRALSYATNLARHYGSNLRILHVFDPLSYSENLDGVQRRAAEVANERLNGIPHQFVLEVGDVFEVLKRCAEQNDVDLVVLGTHGRKGVSKLLEGSMAERVFRHVVTPVLTIGPYVASHLDQGEFSRVLYATDFSMASERALPYALSIAVEYGAQLSLVHAIIPSEAPQEDPSGAITSQYRLRLAAIVPADSGPRSVPDVIVEHGLAAETILSVASRRGTELIVMGVRSKGTFRASTRLPWPVAHNVVSRAECPVLTIRDMD